MKKQRRSNSADIYLQDLIALAAGGSILAVTMAFLLVLYS